MRGMNARFTIVVDVASDADGTLRIAARPADPFQALRLPPTLLTVTIWSDGDDVVRASVQHRGSRTLAYVQGNRALRELCERLRVELSPLAEAQP